MDKQRTTKPMLGRE